jgi:hypothetical protein
MNQEMKLIREVNSTAEQFYDDAVALGDHAAVALGGSEKESHRSQITNLETIAESTFKTSDVFDYIKKQIARQKKTGGWRHPVQHRGKTIMFGDALRDYLEHDLEQKISTICTRLDIQNATDADKRERKRIHLLLIRQFLRQMAAEYEYQVSVGTKKEESQG